MLTLSGRTLLSESVEDSTLFVHYTICLRIVMICLHLFFLFGFIATIVCPFMLDGEQDSAFSSMLISCGIIIIQ